MVAAVSTMLVGVLSAGLHRGTNLKIRGVERSFKSREKTALWLFPVPIVASIVDCRS